MMDFGDVILRTLFPSFMTIQACTVQLYSYSLKMGLQAGSKFWRCIIDQNPNPVLHCQLNFTIQSAASSQKTFHDFKLPWWVAKKLILLWLQPAAVVPYSEPSAST